MKYWFFIALLVSTIQGFSFQNSSQNKPFVSCVLSGQLGNQLFEIATTLAYAWDNNMDPIFPELNSQELNIPINKQRIFFRLNASPLPRNPVYGFRHFKNYEKLTIPIIADQYLNGYFQTWEYFDHYRDRICAIFAPRPEELAWIKKKHAELLKHPNTVAVHVRTFNERWSKMTPFVGIQYYEDAMKFFPRDTLFVVFSDRINWCKHHFAHFHQQIVFIESQDHIEDFFLMSMLKHNIICNSSFSWWAAYLNQNPDQVVIAPRYFVHPKYLAKFNANMPDWIVLETDYDYLTAPYPRDIRNYDARSQSIDTQ